MKDGAYEPAHSMRATMPHAMDRPMTAAQLSTAKRIGLGFVFVWFLVGGIAHFAATDTVMRVVPPYIPWPRAAVLSSGVFELLGALGLCWRPTRRAAGVGLFVLTLAVTPAHIYMLQQPELFPVPMWALWLRLPIQVALLWLILWCTAAPAAPAHGGRR
jgi:uncharacterized membrane protein